MAKNTGSPSGSDTSVASGTILGKRKLTTTDLPEYSWPEESLLKNIRRNTHEFTSIQRKRDAYAMRYQFLADKFHHNDTTETRLAGNSDSQRYEIEYSNNMPLSNELQLLKHEEQFRKLEVQTGETPKLPSWMLEKGNICAQSESKGSLSIPSYTSYIEKSQSEPVVQNTALTKTLLATFCNDDLSVTRRAMGTFQQSSSQTDRSNILSDRRASMDKVNEFDTSCSFGQRGQVFAVFQKIESNNAPKSCDEQKDIQTEGQSNVGDSEGFNKENKKSSLVEEFASRYDQNPDKSFKLEKQKLNHGSLRFEENSRSKLHKSSLAAGKIWVGSLQLNSSIAVPAVAFFKSGEKLLDVNWYELVDVKGKVRLEAFEKYIQELSRSRHRGLMVISVCCNEGSETDIKHMQEVAKGYVNGERVGLARLSQGVDLYLCPRTDTIITILAKHGFFKGLAAIESKCELFIGCVVWRKNHSVAKKSESNTNNSQSEQLQKSLPDSIDVQAVGKISSVGDVQPLASAKSSSVAESNDIKDNQNAGGVDNSSSNAISLPMLLPAEQREPVPSKSESQVTPGQVCYAEPARGNVELLKYVLALPSNTSSQKKPFNDDDLPEFDFGSAGRVSKSSDGKSSDAHLLKRTRTEDGSGNLTRYLAHSVLLSKPTASNSAPHSVLVSKPTAPNLAPHSVLVSKPIAPSSAPHSVLVSKPIAPSSAPHSVLVSKPTAPNSAPHSVLVSKPIAPSSAPHSVLVSKPTAPSSAPHSVLVSKPTAPYSAPHSVLVSKPTTPNSAPHSVLVSKPIAPSSAPHSVLVSKPTAPSSAPHSVLVSKPTAPYSAPHSVLVSKPTASNSAPNIDVPPNREASVHGAPLPLPRRVEGRHAHQSHTTPPPTIAIPKIPFADLGKKIFFDDDDDMPEWLPPDLKKQSFAKRSNIPTTTNPGFKNLPFHHHPPPPRPLPPPPNPPMFSSSAVPPLPRCPLFNSKVPPPVPSRDGQSYMTGFTFNPVLQPPVPSRDGQSYMTGFTFNPVLQPPSGPLAVRSPLQPAGGVWRP